MKRRDAATFSVSSPINCSTKRIITHFSAFPAALSTQDLLLRARRRPDGYIIRLLIIEFSGSLK